MLSAIKISFFLIENEIDEFPVGAHLSFFLVSYLESLLITASINILVKLTYLTNSTNHWTIRHVSSIIPEETKTSLQHLVNYSYVERWSKNKVLSCFRKQREEKERLCIEAEQRKAALKKGRADQAKDCKPFVDKALSVMEQLTNQVFSQLRRRGILLDFLFVLNNEPFFFRRLLR